MKPIIPMCRRGASQLGIRAMSLRALVGAGLLSLGACSSGGDAVARQAAEAGANGAANDATRTAALPASDEIVLSSPGMALPPLSEGTEIAAGVDGRFVATWRATSGEGEGVHAAIFDADGLPIRSAFLVEAGGSDPVVGMDASGGFVVAWRRQAGGRSSIHYQRFDAHGMPASEVASATQIRGLLDIGPLPDALLLQLDASEGPARPRIAMHPDGDFAITWWRFLRTRVGNPLGMFGSPSLRGPGVVYARAFDAEGAPKRLPAIVSTQLSVLSPDTRPALTMNDDGDFTVVWRQDTAELRSRRYDASGQARGPAEPFATEARTALLPDIASDAIGHQTVVWLSGQVQDVVGQRLDHNGVPQGGRFEVAPEVRRTPRMAMAPMGHFAVTWARSVFDDDGDFVAHNVFLRCFAADGTPKGDAIVANAQSLSTRFISSDTTLPAASYDGFGTLVLVWRSHDDSQQIRARRFSDC